MKLGDINRKTESITCLFFCIHVTLINVSTINVSQQNTPVKQIFFFFPNRLIDIPWLTHTERIPPHYHNTVNIAELCIKSIVLGWTFYTLNTDKHYPTQTSRLKDGPQFSTWNWKVAAGILRVKKRYSLTIKLTLTFKNGCQDEKYSSIVNVCLTSDDRPMQLHPKGYRTFNKSHTSHDTAFLLRCFLTCLWRSPLQLGLSCCQRD